MSLRTYELEVIRTYELSVIKTYELSVFKTYELSVIKTCSLMSLRTRDDFEDKKDIGIVDAMSTSPHNWPRA
jgi:hypothetical protein